MSKEAANTPLDVVAFASSLHAEVAWLRSRACSHRALFDAATAQLEALRATPRDTHVEKAAVDRQRREAAAVTELYDRTADNMLVIAQDVDAIRAARPAVGAVSPTHVTPPLYPNLRILAGQLGFAKSVQALDDKAPPKERYDFLKRLCEAAARSSSTPLDTATATELRRCYDDVVSSLPGLKDVVEALTKIAEGWRRVDDVSDDMQLRLRRDATFAKLQRHVAQMKLLHDVAAPTPQDVKEYEDLADLVVANLTSMAFPTEYQVQGYAEALLVELRRLRGDMAMAASIRRICG